MIETTDPLFLPIALLLAVLAAAWLMLRLGRNAHLAAEGVDAPGRVLHKHQAPRWLPRSRQLGRLVYEYCDTRGRRYARGVQVPTAVWAAHQEGGPIAVTYSRRRPFISAPSVVVRHAREVAFAKERKRYSR